MPKSRPTRSIVVNMLTREADVDDNMSKLGPIYEHMEIKVGGT